MKRLRNTVLAGIALLMVLAPAFAINDVDKVQEAQRKYELKIEKIKQKQALKCAKHPEKCVSPVKEQNMTLGVVQKEIKIGTSQTDVALALGSPNIVTRDADGKDTWIYDKMASISSYSNSGFSIGAGGFGGGIGGSAIGGGLLSAGYGSNKGNVQTNKKTLTVVIKFDKNSNVESFNYHMSSF